MEITEVLMNLDNGEITNKEIEIEAEGDVQELFFSPSVSLPLEKARKK
ncbi:7509_t:CDS:2 [Diversispora eburnea]|uniref:7509_t:CDS:1 n=1 Tax=Diversispora eburnea TaxID=1213867 RepID=A0A9N8YK57_9GLOM|nr:7509_t:CDS:2 [Diversispora eburnea]